MVGFRRNPCFAVKKRKIFAIFWMKIRVFVQELGRQMALVSFGVKIPVLWAVLLKKNKAS